MKEGMNKKIVVLLLHLNSMLFSVQPIREHKNIPSVKKSYFHKHKKLLCTGVVGVGLLISLATVRFGILQRFFKIFDVENNELTTVIKEIVPTIVSAEMQEVQYTYKNTVIHQPALFITIADEEKVSELDFLLELREKIKTLPYMQQHWPDLNKIRVRDSARKWADKNDYFIGAG